MKRNKRVIIIIIGPLTCIVWFLSVSAQQLQPVLLLCVMPVIASTMPASLAFTGTSQRTVIRKFRYQSRRRSSRDSSSLLVGSTPPDTDSNDDSKDYEKPTVMLSKNLHLLSLQWTPQDDDDPSKFSKAVTDVWRWKDAVLGDGRDFFVPKPRTLQALQSLFLQSLSLLDVEECVILSNCARFEILLVVAANNTNTNNTNNNVPIALAVSELLQRQVEAYRKRPMQLAIPLDWPGNIIVSDTTTDDAPQSSSSSNSGSTAKELARHWTHLQGSHDISRHLCLVAAGMAVRPRRVDRQVLFQPFSSRDAHIMLQLRRTMAIIIVKKKQGSSSSSSSYSYLQTLLRFAIQAGKACRTPAKVPELQELRQYGSGDNAKYSTTPPPEVSQRVAEAAIRRAIEPAVEECVETFQAMEQSSSISQFRQCAEAMASTDKELQWVRQRLHDPTLRIRKGERVDQCRFLDNLVVGLKEIRS